MNIQKINTTNDFYKSQIKFRNSLSEQLGLDVAVRDCVDAYMPAIKKKLKN